MSGTDSRAKGARLVSVTNAVVAVGLVVALAGVAVVVRPPAPPGIAEFAPQASKPITKAPLSQGAASGPGPGACTDGQSCLGTPTPRPAPSAVIGSKGTRAGVPSALQCFEWSDGSVTQTEDPQSPPCVASWPGAEAGNGGSTSRGVTGSEILVAADEFWSTNGKRTAQALVRHFNSRYMLYGRKIRLVFPHYGGDTAGFASELRRAAAAAYVSARPFAAAGFTDDQNTSEFIDYLTRHHVVTAMATAGDASTDFLRARTPYAWTYGQALDQVEANLAEMVCHSLPARARATYGGTTAALPRKFAVLVAEKQPDLTWLRDGLASCGVTAKVFTVPSDRDPAVQANKLPEQTQLMLQVKAGDYTSLVYIGIAGHAPMQAADNAGYQPEWISAGIGELGNYPDAVWQQQPVTQTRHLLGLGTANKPLQPADDAAQAICQQQGCISRRRDILLGYYQPLLLLASGIQAAGPRLTPESFAAGLRSLAFPNPSLEGTRLFGVGRVGFGDQSRSMMRDFGAFAWDLGATTRIPASRGRTGASCLLLRGARWQLGSWPRDLDFTKTKPCY